MDDRPYGDLSRLNKSRLILDAIGSEALSSIAEGPTAKKIAIVVRTLYPRSDAAFP